METTNDRKFDQKLKSSGSPWSPQVNTRKRKFKTQSPKFMCGPMYIESRQRKCIDRRGKICHSTHKQHLDSNLMRAWRSELKL